MTTILISPAERPPITNLGQTSSLCEKVGSDILFETNHGLFGVQRKEQADLVASVRDGRLGRELEQMATLVRGFLVVEGTPAWDREGNLQSQHTRWTLKQQNGVLLAVQSKGVMVLHSRNPLETCAVVEHLIEWCSKSDHVSSLIAREKPQTHWGKMDDRTTTIHVWSSLPAVGTTRAAMLYDAGVRLFRCGTTMEELVAVKGIGEKTAKAIMDCIADKPVIIQEGRS